MTMNLMSMSVLKSMRMGGVDEVIGLEVKGRELNEVVGLELVEVD